MRSSRSVLLISLFIGYILTGCCSLCKMEDSIVYEVDTLYHVDTITAYLPGEVVYNSEELESAYTSLDFMTYLYDSIYSLNELANDSFKILASNAESLTTPVNHEYSDMFYSDTSSLETDFAYSTAYVYGGSIEHFLWNKESAEIIIDSLKVIINNNKFTIYECEEVTRKFKSYRKLTFLFGGLLAIVVILMFTTLIRNIVRGE